MAGCTPWLFEPGFMPGFFVMAGGYEPRATLTSRNSPCVPRSGHGLFPDSEGTAAATATGAGEGTALLSADRRLGLLGGVGHRDPGRSRSGDHFIHADHESVHDRS